MRCLAVAISAAILASCAGMDPPGNNSPILFDREKTGDTRNANLTFNETQCPPAGTAGFIMPPPHVRRQPALTPELRLSAGDRINVFVPNSLEFSGDYVVGNDGMVRLPFMPGLTAAGLTSDAFTKNLERAFVKNRLFVDNDFRVSVRAVQFSAVNITISGAVFLPGRFSVGGSRETAAALNKFGDNPIDRDVASAMRAGGGVRPDADLSQVKLLRAGRIYVLDWRGAMTWTTGRRRHPDRWRSHRSRRVALLSIWVGATVADHTARRSHIPIQPDTTGDVQRDLGDRAAVTKPALWNTSVGGVGVDELRRWFDRQ